MSVIVADFNNDTRLDIVVTNQNDNDVSVLLGHGNGTFASLISFSLAFGSNPFLVATGDLDNDRKLDIVVANEGIDNLNILLQTC